MSSRPRRRALAYRVVRGGEGSGADGDEVKAESEESERDLVAEAYVQPDRLRIEFVGGRGEVMGPASPQSPPTPPERRTPCQTEGGPAAADAGVRRGRRAGKAGSLSVFEAVVAATGKSE